MAWRFALWLLGITLCSLLLLWQLTQARSFDSSILALLPDTHRSPAEELAQQRLIDSADNQLLVLVGSGDSDQATTQSLHYAQQLLQLLTDSGLFEQVQGAPSEADTQQWQNFYQPYRYHLLTPASAERLEQRDSQLVSDSLTRLFSPLAAAIAPTLVDDPLQLFQQWQLASLPATSVSLQDGWPSARDQGRLYRLIVVTLSDSAYDFDYQQAVMQQLHTLRQQLPADIELKTSGLILHAAHGTQQARQEISTIGVGSVIGIVLLLWSCFGRPSAVMLAFLPLLSGFLLAMAVSLLLFERLHLITLAFGASLIGVAIDYSLHYLCAQREHPQQSILPRILPGLSLALLSSGLAYAAQAIAPFPGLRQMAVFSVLGLIGAWLTVVCGLPFLSRVQHLRSNDRGLAASWTSRLERWQGYWPNLQSWPLKAWSIRLTLISLLFGLVYLVSQQPGSDDLRLLQTSPQALLDQDAQVQALLGSPNPSQYFLIQGSDPEQLRQREERLQPALQQAMAAGWISDYQALSRSIPSRQQQQRNYQLYAQQVFSATGLLVDWADQAQLQPLASEARQRFRQTPDQPLEFADWLQQPVSQLSRRLWLGSPSSGQENGPVFSVITLSGVDGAAAISRLSTLAATDPNVVFVDRISDLSAVLHHYRQQLSQWLLLAYGLVTVLLLCRYGRHTWRLLAAPAIASLITLASLTTLGIPVTLFHVLALLLVLGIGLDTSIFLYDSGNSPHTWLAVSLSALTTLLAFGLLTLSATPVLHFFGQTVLIGLIGVWLLAPVFTRQAPAGAQSDSGFLSH